MRAYGADLLDIADEIEPSPGVENDIVVFLAPQHPHAGR